MCLPEAEYMLGGSLRGKESQNALLPRSPLTSVLASSGEEICRWLNGPDAPAPGDTGIQSAPPKTGFLQFIKYIRISNKLNSRFIYLSNLKLYCTSEIDCSIISVFKGFVYTVGTL